MKLFANNMFQQDKINFRNISPKIKNIKEYHEAIKEEDLAKLGYDLKPRGFFSEVTKRSNKDNEEVDTPDKAKTNFILEHLQKS